MLFRTASLQARGPEEHERAVAVYRDLGGPRSLNDQSRWTHMAMPMPPPMQRVARPFLASRFCIS
jgi:hypothetical protein